MRLLLVVCVTILVVVFLWIAYATLAASCHNLVVEPGGSWCLPASGVA